MTIGTQTLTDLYA